MFPGFERRRIDLADAEINLEEDWQRFSAYLDAQGTDPASMDRVALQYLHLVTDEDPETARQAQLGVYDNLLGVDRTVEHAAENWLTGTIEEVQATLAEYDRLGFDEVLLHPMSTQLAELDRQLRLYRRHLLSEYQ